MRNLGKCPECLQRFHVEWQGKFFDFESPDSAISRSPMILMKSKKLTVNFVCSIYQNFIEK
jgi:hypothetical protein